MLGAHAQAQEEGFFGGVKMRYGNQLVPLEDDNLRMFYLGAGYELGYNFAFGKMSAELGILYKPGKSYITDLNKMETERPINTQHTVGNQTINSIEHSVEGKKNWLNGMTLRVAYEKPMEKFSLRSGLQFGALKFRQEMIGDVRSTAMDAPPNGTFPLWRDTYNGVNDTGGLSISPFFGISVPVLSNHFIETNFVLLNYTAGNYIHVAGTEEGRGPGQSKKDYIKENGRLIPHIEIAFGFRF
ncbi:MAG: hypothetical protein FWG12_03670 [Holophagaceae bacterium]|nr:hypothetical protein [Holophagaceae bacterium]